MAILPSESILIALVIGFVAILAVFLKNFLDKRKIIFTKYNNEKKFSPLLKGSLEPNIYVDCLDLKYECIGEVISTTKGFKGEQIRLLENFSRVGEKPIRLSKRITGAFADQGKLFISILLANRLSMLSIIDYQQFCYQLRSITKAQNLTVNIPCFDDVMKRAKLASKKISSLDKKLALSILCVQPPSSNTLRGLMSVKNLLEYVEGRYVKLSENGEVNYSVGFGADKLTITFLLDLPRVKSPYDKFLDMFDQALWLSNSINGKVSDDRGVLIPSSEKLRIASQVMQKEKELEVAGIKPGSDLALRIFC
mgnify:CR=1 FL=1|tara:strand:- start:12375 stop:13301 length:927 start_codon:yes stop_codon:yes gene_type:complete